MPWFRRGVPGGGPSSTGEPAGRSRVHYEPINEADSQADQEALERGDLPDRVVRRIEAGRSGELPWLSTLSVPDWYLAAGLQLEPLGVAAGSAYYHVSTDMQGREYLDANGDAANLVRGYYAARDLAVDRLRDEARLAGGQAVVDAEVTLKREERVIEVSIIGTAVRLRGVKDGGRIPVSPLSGEEFFKLAERGWMPMGLAFGYHWHVMPAGYRTQQLVGSNWGQNQELTAMSQRFSQTRQWAIQALQRDAARLGASGVVGVRLSTAIEETEILYTGGFPGQTFRVDDTWYRYEDNGSVEVPAFNLEFFATGAAVAKISQQALTSDAVGRFLGAV